MLNYADYLSPDATRNYYQQMMQQNPYSNVYANMYNNNPYNNMYNQNISQQQAQPVQQMPPQQQPVINQQVQQQIPQQVPQNAATYAQQYQQQLQQTNGDLYLQTLFMDFLRSPEMKGFTDDFYTKFSTFYKNKTGLEYPYIIQTVNQNQPVNKTEVKQDNQQTTVVTEQNPPKFVVKNR